MKDNKKLIEFVRQYNQYEGGIYSDRRGSKVLWQSGLSWDLNTKFLFN